MRRFYTPLFPAKTGIVIDLPTEVTRHLSTVLRQQPGSLFELFNGAGGVARCVLETEGKQARILEIKQLDAPALKIELIQGLAKGEKLDLVLQKGTELGLSNFVLTPSERSMVKISQAKKASRIDRWQKIVYEACRQSGQLFAPTVELSDNLTTALNNAKGDLKLMLWEEASAPLPQLLPKHPPAIISLLVGPEGGFSAPETAQAQAAGFKTLRLGPRILRTETAGLAILSILQYVYGDFSSAEGSFSSRTNGKEFS